MNQNGFTGYDPSVVQTQINAFGEYMKRACWNLNDAYDDFIEELRTAWCSPKAVEFSDRFATSFFTALTNLETGVHNIVVAATRAYNAHARANDLPTINTDDGPVAYEHKITQLGVSLYEQSPENGVVGMNKTNVRTYKELFVKKVNEQLETIANAPYDIAFYDEDGSQVAAYKHEIDRLASNVEQVFKEMCFSMDEAIETEISTMELAKKEATSSLNG